MAERLEGWRRYTGKTAIILCFLFCAFPVGLMCTLVTPPGQSPDEPAHLARALGLLHGAVLAKRRMLIDPGTGKPDLQAGIKVDNGLLEAAVTPVTMFGLRPVVTTQDFLATRAEPADHSVKIPNLPNTATYFPAAYVPAALGLGLGLAVHAPPYACFLFGRLFMLAAFLMLGVLALAVTAYGEAALLVVLLLPMSLFLGATINQDGVLIGMVCLACAALTRRMPAYRILALVLFVLFLGGKPPYILMLGAFALPLFGPGFFRRVAEVVIACLPVLAWVVFVSLCIVVPFFAPPYHPGPLYTGDRGVWMNTSNAAMNLHILLAKPSRMVTLPWSSLSYWGTEKLREMIGVLGPLQIQLPDPYYRLWGYCGAVALAGLVLTRRPWAESGAAKILNFGFVLILALVTFWLLMMIGYIDWSEVGQDYIGGVQGRYILPLLPFLLLAVPGLSWRFELPPLLPALPAIAMGIYDIGYIPMKLVWNYYLH